MKYVQTLIVALAMFSTAGLVGCGGKDECADTASCETATGAATGTATGGTTGTGTTGS